MNDIYQEAIKSKKIGLRKFASFGHYVHLITMQVTRTVPGVYSFTNLAFKHVYIMYLNDDFSFNNIPGDWDVNKAPSADAEPTHWVIRQEDQALKPHVKLLNNHSLQTGDKHYLKPGIKEVMRSEYVHLSLTQEDENLNNRSKCKIDDEIAAKRRKCDDDE